LARGVLQRAWSPVRGPEDALSIGLGANVGGSLGSGEKSLREGAPVGLGRGYSGFNAVPLRAVPVGSCRSPRSSRCKPRSNSSVGACPVTSSASQCFFPLHFLLHFLACVSATCHIGANAELARHSCTRHRLCFAWIARTPLLTGLLPWFARFCVVQTRSRRGVGSPASLSCRVTVASRRQLQGIGCSGQLANASMQTARPTWLTTVCERAREVICSSACCAK